jgi:hypothetical protein
MAVIADYIFDLALAQLDTATSTFHLCSSEPANYAAIAGVQLGTKTGLSIGSPENRTPTGRKVVVAAITDGTVTATGTAAFWVISKDGTTLMASGALSASQAVTIGNQFTTPAFDIGFADAT